MPYASGARQASPSPPIRPLRGSGSHLLPEENQGGVCGMAAGKRQTAWPASTVSRASASGWRWRRRAWECAAGFAGGRSPFLPARDQKSACGRRKGRGWSPLLGPKRPGARKGRHFVQGKACPIVFRVGMFGYVRLSYVRYFCWSLVQPQMPPDRHLPILHRRRLLPTPGSRFCVANAGSGLAWGLHSHDTPCAFRYPLLRYALTD